MSYLNEKNQCQGCLAEEGEGVGQVGKLKTCSRCQIAQYCSVTCQKSDFGQHKMLCKEIKALTTEVIIFCWCCKEMVAIKF